MAKKTQQGKIDIALPSPHKSILKKIYIGVAIVFILVLLVFYTESTAILGTGGENKLPFKMLASQIIDSKASQFDISQKKDIGQDPEKNILIGPIKLDSSSYVYDKLQESSKNLQTSSNVSLQEESQSSVSLDELWSNPFSFVSKLAMTTKNTWVNDGRKTTLIKLVESVSRYYISFGKFPVSDGVFTNQDYEWVSEMVDKNEMSGVYEYVLRTTSPVAYCGSSSQTGYCFQTDNKNAILYVRLEKFGDSALCEEGDIFFMWSSLDNKLGSVCLNKEPVELGGFEYFKF
ncbi:MAG: hypothetical protein HZC02_03485 [Candidatus Levybacteria bacterium]|nr:hypothetical protein [Candidatus Levybacteria bacterium]